MRTRSTNTETITLVFPNSAYADPDAEFTAPVFITAKQTIKLIINNEFTYTNFLIEKIK